jgi:hypothetical protein
MDTDGSIVVAQRRTRNSIEELSYREFRKGGLVERYVELSLKLRVT